VDTLYANTRNNPIEDIESHYPLRIRRYELREDVAGAGRWRGGLGSVRDVEFLEDGRFSLEGDGHLHAPWGLFDGEPGTTGDLVLNPGSEREELLPSMIPDRRVRRGDVLRLLGPCGGGYGPPRERDPAAVARDVADGLVSAEAARERYGVVIAADGSVDEAATVALRRGA
jgi:N-methylhydantoinase B